VTRTVWIVMVLVILGIGIPAIIETTPHTRPRQEAARLVRVPTEVERRVIVPPCGTGVDVASITPDNLAKTSGSIVFRLKQGRGDRLVLVPRCQAAEGAKPSEGVNLPSAAFVLPVGAELSAGRAGSIQAGTELVQSQLVIPANSTIKTVVVPRCIETAFHARQAATGRTLILNAERNRPAAALAGPC
jgi:hypothetical protein